MSPYVIYLPRELRKQIQQGHPWIYRDSLPEQVSLLPGTWVQVRCGKLARYGLWDAQSPIAVRLFSSQQVPDGAWIAERVRQAWKLRAPLRNQGITAYRWVYGEGDGIPGVVVDLYAQYAVIETYADSVETLLDWIVPALRASAPLRGILLRKGRVRSLWGREPPRDLIVEEHGLRMHVDLFAGQKTGLFLDQRENRRYLEEWCAGQQVLNCFAYTGGFTLYAVRGGADRVVSVDIAPQTAHAARDNLSLNGFDPDQHPFVVGDCFELLDTYAAQGERFDLIVLDPPSLARSKKSRHAALRAYGRLNQSAMRCIPPGGLLATASCTSQVSPQAFRDMLGAAAAQAGRRMLILHEAGQALDHPVPAHFGEGRYLKFVLGRIELAL
jgi:23S rRNA (cytosine1962-C5)-methyltransferase